MSWYDHVRRLINKLHFVLPVFEFGALKKSKVHFWSSVMIVITATTFGSSF